MRQVYPADLFVRRKKYDTPVFQSRHPSLNEYISGAVKAIGEELVLVYTFQRASEIAALSFFVFAGQCRQGCGCHQRQESNSAGAVHILSAKYDRGRALQQGY